MNSTLPKIGIIYFPRPGRLRAHINSRIRSLDIPEDIVSAVLDQFGMEVTESPRNLPNTRRNRNLIVSTTSGRKVLKLYRSDWSASTISFEHSILKRLAEQSFPAPRLVGAGDGSTVVSVADGFYSLFDFIDGKNFTASFLVRSHRLRLMALAGSTLARLHRQLEGFEPAASHHVGMKSYRGDRHRDLSWYRKRTEEMITASKQLKDEQAKTLAQQLAQHSQEVLEQLGQLDEQLNHAQLPILIIHGDYGLHNLVFHPARTTPVDFELSRLEWRLTELVSCLAKLRYADGFHDFESIHAFLGAYLSVYPILEQEWRYLPLAWRYYRLSGTLNYWNSFFETMGPTAKLRKALDAYKQANWAMQHAGTILSLRDDAMEVFHA